MSDKNPRDAAARLDPAHGGMLKELIVEGAEHEALEQHALSLPSVVLGEPQLLDLALLLNGAFSPLDGFLNEGDWESVVRFDERNRTEFFRRFQGCIVRVLKSQKRVKFKLKHPVGERSGFRKIC